MATGASLRTRIYEQLYSAFPNDRPFETLVTEAMDGVETDMDVTDGTDWDEGDIAESVETGEQMLVTAVATNTLTVIRGYGSVAAGAISINTRLRKNPRFTQDQLDTALRDSLNQCSAWGIHGFATGSITLASSVFSYDLAETDIDVANGGVLSLYFVPPNETSQVRQALPFRQEFQLDTGEADWSTATQLIVLSKGSASATDTVYFTYAQSLDYDTDLDTTIAKLAQGSEEAVVLGAVTRLLGGTIIPMTQDHGQRTDRSVPPGQTSRDVRYFQGQFFVAARAEAARLAVLRQRLPRDRRTNRVRRWRW